MRELILTGAVMYPSSVGAEIRAADFQVTTLRVFSTRKRRLMR